MLFPSEYIYVLNIAVVLIIALFAYSGYRQGFLLKALGCFGFLVCGLLSLSDLGQMPTCLSLLREYLPCLNSGS